MHLVHNMCLEITLLRLVRYLPGATESIIRNICGLPHSFNGHWFYVWNWYLFQYTGSVKHLQQWCVLFRNLIFFILTVVIVWMCYSSLFYIEQILLSQIIFALWKYSIGLFFVMNWHFPIQVVINQPLSTINLDLHETCLKIRKNALSVEIYHHDTSPILSMKTDPFTSGKLIFISGEWELPLKKCSW